MIVAADSLLPTMNHPSKADQRPTNVEDDVQNKEGEEIWKHPILADRARRERQTIETPDPGTVFIRQPHNDEKRGSVVRAKHIDWKEQRKKKNGEEEDSRTKARLGASFEKHRSRIERILEPYEEMLNGRLGVLKSMENRVQLAPVSKSVHQALYWAAPLQRQIEKKKIDKMLEKEVIEPATKDWASPIVFDPNSEGSLRFCL